jgi:Sugar phosphate isomerases/epimerases
MIEEIKSLGFKKVELNYEVTEDMVCDISKMVENGEIEVTSIHNVFPKTYDRAFGPDSFLLGFEDRTMREKGVQFTKTTVDYAAGLGAMAVVIHPGEIPISKDYNSLLVELIEQGKKKTPEYTHLFEEMINYREVNSPRYVKLIGDSLEEICDYIARKGYDITLGLENRVRCNQIPVFHEVHTLLDRLRGLPVRFWYDVGHGMILEQLGIFNNLREINTLKGQIIGVHIHDVKLMRDHICPFIMDDSFNKYMDTVKHIPIKVLELSSMCSKEDVTLCLKLITEALAKI